MKWIFSISIFIILGAIGIAQWGNPASPLLSETPGFCAMEEAHEKALRENPVFAEKFHRLEQEVYQFMGSEEARSALQQRADYTIPVVVHIVHQNGAENLTDAQVIQGVQNLNDAFENVGYYDPTVGVDTKIAFCLAKQDPQGNATNGITRTLDGLTNLTNYTTQDIPLKNLSRWDPLSYINIWLVREICGNNGCGVAGYAYFPSSHGNNNDGIVMEAEYFAQSPGSSGVQVHEMGHYFGLYHTFQGGCANNDCLSDGDGICDTPPDQSTASVPCSGSANSCSTDVNPGDPNNPFTTDQNDMFWNYMDYGDFNCYRAFTQDQSDRMAFFLTGTRQSLLDSRGCNDPCATNIMANFTANPGNMVNAGTLVNFTNSSSNATTYQWFIDGVAQVTTTNFSFNFPTEGVYEIELIAKNADPNCEDSFSLTITVVCPVDAFFNPSTNFAQPGETITFINGSINSSTYNWSANGTDFSTAFEPSYTFGGPGLFTICLTASNGVCEETYCKNIIVSTPGTGCEDTFLRTYGTAGVPENIYCVVNLPNGNMIMGGSYEGEGMLMEMTTEGFILWQKQIFLTSSNNEIRDIILSTDNHIVGIGFNFVGSSPLRQSYIFKYNYQTHTIVWNTVLSYPDQTRFDGVIENAAGNFIAIGQVIKIGIGDCNASWQTFDRDSGIMLTEKIYALGSCEQMADILQRNNQYYTTGRYTPNGTTNHMRPAITLLDNNGDHLWTKLYLKNVTNQDARLYPTKILLENDRLIISGRGDLNGTSGTDVEIFIFSTDLDGNLVWAKAFNIAGGNTEQPNTIISLPTGFILSGNYSVGGQDQGFLINFDKLGNVLWAKSYDTGGENRANALTFQGGNFFLVGDSEESVGNETDFLVGKLDIDGKLSDGCFTDLNLNEVAIPNPYESSFPLQPGNTTIDVSSVTSPVGDFTLEENVICQKICTEICDNGLDDDGDGYVDCYDTECNCIITDCTATVLEENFSARLAWQSTVDKVAINSTPIVGNLNPNEDDIPEIIVCESRSSASSLMANEVMIFKGDGSNANAPRSLNIPGNFDGYPLVHPSIGDVNGDGIPELIMISGNRRLQVFTDYQATGPTVMTSMVVSPDLVEDRNMKALLADFNKDGISEIYVGNDVYQFDFSGATPTLQKVLNGTGSFGQLWWNEYLTKACNPIAADFLDPADCGGDPDCEGLEIAAGNMIFSIDLSNIDGDAPQIKMQRNLNSFSNDVYKDGYTSVADIDLDGTLDILVSAERNNLELGVYAWNKNGLLAFFPLPDNSVKFGGSVTVSNVFDDTSLGFPVDLPEIMVTSGLRLNCYNLSALINTPATPYWWSLPTTDGSGATGITVFDFNGDDIKEIVYRDQDFLRIMYGGNVPYPPGVDSDRNYSTFISGSGTFEETPIVADVDNDGEAEIALTSFTYSGNNTPASDYRGRLRVFESDPATGGPWMSARQVWNQHNYFVANVNDDLTIPAEQQLHHLEFPAAGSGVRPYNNFLAQVSILNNDYTPFLSVADAYPVIDDAICESDSISLKVTICNQGDAPLVSRTPISFYDANPTLVAANLIYRDSVGKVIEKDSCLVCDIRMPIFNGTFFLVVNDDFSIPAPYSLANDFPATDIPECNYMNNIDSFEIMFTPIPPLDLGPDTAVCANGIFPLDAGPGYDSYLWNDGTLERNNTVYEPGIYWVEVSGNCGQLLRDTIVIDLIPNTEVVLPADLIICAGDTVVLAVDGFSTVQWYPDPFLGCNNCDSVMIAPTDSVVVTVVVTSSPGCYSSDSINIMVEPPSIINDSLVLCTGDTIMLNGNPVWEAGDYSFNGTNLNGCDSIHNTHVLMAAEYFFADSISICEGDTAMVLGQQVWQNEIVQLPLISSFGCDSIYQTTVLIIETIVNSENQNICAGDTILLFGNPVWEAGIYSETYTLANGCDSISTVSLMVDPYLTDQQQTSFCDGDTLFALGQMITTAGLYDSIVPQSIGCDSLYQLQVELINLVGTSETLFLCPGDTLEVFGQQVWDDGVFDAIFTSPINGCDSVHEITVQMNQQISLGSSALVCEGEGYFWMGDSIYLAGNYAGMLTGFGSDCDTLINLELSTATPPTADWDTEDTCLDDANGIIAINPDGVNPPYIYNWSDPNFIGETVDNVPPGNYALTLTDDNGCHNIYEIEVEAIATPIVQLPSISTIDLGTNQILTPTVISSEPVDYFWSPAEGLSCTDCPNPRVAIIDDATYILTVINSAGCMASDTIQLRVNKNREVYIPNVFSPNNDGLNDAFTVYGNESLEEIISLKIFNRWGDVMAAVGPIPPNDPLLGWDGQFKNKLMNAGVYVYYINVRFVDGLTREYAGDITLIR